MNETLADNWAVIERQGDRLIITIAPLGVRAADEEGAWGLLGFAIFGTIALVALTVICIILAIGIIPRSPMAVNDDSPHCSP